MILGIEFSEFDKFFLFIGENFIEDVKAFLPLFFEKSTGDPFEFEFFGIGHKLSLFHFPSNNKILNV